SGSNSGHAEEQLGRFLVAGKLREVHSLPAELIDHLPGVLVLWVHYRQHLAIRGGKIGEAASAYKQVKTRKTSMATRWPCLDYHSMSRYKRWPGLPFFVSSLSGLRMRSASSSDQSSSRRLLPSAECVYSGVDMRAAHFCANSFGALSISSTIDCRNTKI